MPMLMNDFGVSSFKIFMFYGGHGLHGKSDQQHNFLKLEEGEKYDFAHFEFIMRKLSEMIEANPKQAPHISLSLHCEVADILNAYTSIVQEEGKLKGLMMREGTIADAARRVRGHFPHWRLRCNHARNDRSC